MDRELPDDPLEDGARYPQGAPLATADKHARFIFKQADDGPARVAHELRDFGYG
jgi:hypothetical protein